MCTVHCVECIFGEWMKSQNAPHHIPQSNVTLYHTPFHDKVLKKMQGTYLVIICQQSFNYTIKSIKGKCRFPVSSCAALSILVSVQVAWPNTYFNLVYFVTMVIRSQGKAEVILFYRFICSPLFGSGRREVKWVFFLWSTLRFVYSPQFLTAF